MSRVEYLLIVDSKSNCNTVTALAHLLQSDSNIKVSADKKSVYFKKLNIELKVVKGRVETENGSKSVYFDITFNCESARDLVKFNEFLRSVRKILSSLASTPSALQIIWDDVSKHYAQKAYPLISSTENLMRKLITKFMHINVGLDWTEGRVPDDVQKSVNSNNTDSTYLYNVDFIKLKDLLLSETFNRDRDELISQLKSSDKTSFKKEEIEPLIPTSNWERYFSDQVSCSSEELSNLWSKLYDLRCKVAHNKTFTNRDLEETKKITKRLDSILNEAVDKLDDIHVDKQDAQSIVDSAISSATKSDNKVTLRFIDEYRNLSSQTFRATTPMQPKREDGDNEKRHRSFRHDLRLLARNKVLTQQDLSNILKYRSLRSRLTHKINDFDDFETLHLAVDDLEKINQKIYQSIQSANNK